MKTTGIYSRPKPKRAKFTEQQVYAILRGRVTGFYGDERTRPKTAREWATDYGVSVSTIRAVLHGATPRYRWLRWHFYRDRAAGKRQSARMKAERDRKDTYAGWYGADNPWARWLAEHHPDKAELAPYALRREMGVPATIVQKGGMRVVFR